jgi:8-oxo-dGTP diphosphatase
MFPRNPRLAVRAIIIQNDRLLLVNAYPDGVSDLWCAPGGGVEAGQSLPANLAREVHEETGLEVEVGQPVLINEFHDPDSGFHQVEVFFRCALRGGRINPEWTDPEGVVSRRRFFLRDELSGIRFKPETLTAAAWDATDLRYDPLERIVR